MDDEFTMPINRPGPAIEFVWTPTEDQMRQCYANHRRTLTHLKSQGGVAWEELRWILLGMPALHDHVGDDRARQTCLELYPQDEG